MLDNLFSKLIKKNDVKENENLVSLIDLKRVPNHVAIIMDGNGRWAQKRALPRTVGHRAGVESLKIIVEACGNIGIKVLTVYAFSTENWKRPQEEVDVLMSLLTEYIEGEMETLYKKGIKIKTLGKINDLPKTARDSLHKAITKTSSNNKLILNLALNYGGRSEIVEAVKRIVKGIENKELKADKIDENLLNQFLYTADLPEPDLLIRPSGEYRLSNFLLWQLAYAEFWYSEVLWPDFRAEHLYKAIVDYQKRDRRFGAIKL